MSSLVVNWLVGPALMFALAWLLLPDLPKYRTGAGDCRPGPLYRDGPDLERPGLRGPGGGSGLVAINSVFQIVAFAALGWFYLQTLPGWLGLETTSAEFSVVPIALSVLVFLGIPLVAGFLTRLLGERRKGRA